MFLKMKEFRLNNSENLETEEEQNSLERFFLNNVNPKITSFAADCLAESYVLSPLWEKNEIKVTLPLENYKSDVDSVMLHLKRVKIHQHLLEIQEHLKKEEITEEETMTVLKDLKELKEIESSIAKVLGIVVLR